VTQNKSDTPAASSIERAWSVYVRTVETLAITGMCVVVIVAAGQVFFRYVVGESLFWSEELMRYLMIWVVFLTAGLAYSRNELLGMRLLVDTLPPRAARVVEIAGRILILVFLLTIAWYGFDFAYRTRLQQSVALQFSLFWVHVSIAVGAVILAIHVVLTDVFRAYFAAQTATAEAHS